jgi:hypothetical protein
MVAVIAFPMAIAARTSPRPQGGAACLWMIPGAARRRGLSRIPRERGVGGVPQESRDVTASADAIRAACDSDLSRYCDNDGQGHAAGQEMTCLLARRDKLSERCRTRIDKVFAASSE